MCNGVGGAGAANQILPIQQQTGAGTGATLQDIGAGAAGISSLFGASGPPNIIGAGGGGDSFTPSQAFTGTEGLQTAGTSGQSGIMQALQQLAAYLSQGQTA